MSNTKQTNDYAVPIAIVIAGVLVSGTIFMSGDTVPPEPKNLANIPTIQEATPPPSQVQPSLENVNPITDADHVLGSRDAKVTIIEYSDFECPFCQRFHNTMNQIMDKYKDSGDVAWVFRQFPLDMHPKNAQRAAIASECVGDLRGEDAFWEFSNLYFERSAFNDRTDFNAVTQQILSELGIPIEEFDTCAVSGKFDSKIIGDVTNAMLTGGSGTPWSVLVTSDGQKFPINGAQPFDTLDKLISSILEK